MLKIYYFLRNKLVILFATLFVPLFFVLARKRKKNYGDAPRILVIPQLTRIGDLVCATPVFSAIKEKYPKSFLAVMVTGKVAGIIKNNPHIDKIVQYQTKGYSNILQNVGMLRFDVGISLTPQPMATATMLLGFIPRRIKLTRESRPFSEVFTDWLNTETLLYRHHTPLPQRYLDLLKFIDIENASVKREVFVSEAGERKAAEVIANIANPPAGGAQQNNANNESSSLRGAPRQSYNNAIKIIGISIAAGNKIKEWGDDNFTELTKLILEKYKNTQIIFIGSKNDEQRISAVVSSLRGVSDEAISVFSATDFSLEELPSLIRRLDLYIAVDTGPIYIAEAIGTPLVDIIGPVDPTEQPPCVGPKNVCVLPPPHIKPTSFVLKRPGENHRAALETTTVESVMSAVDKIL